MITELRSFVSILYASFNYHIIAYLQDVEIILIDTDPHVFNCFRY